MNFKIVTGLSGAGRSQAMKAFEDRGYYCIDNLPPQLFSTFADLCEANRDDISNVALVIDTRGGVFFEDLFQGLERLRERGHSVEIIFLETKEEILIKRFKEARRSHPMNPQGGLLEGIELEKKKLKEVREKSDYVIDTSYYNLSEFKQKLSSILDEVAPVDGMSIYIKSFGFKKGIPIDADMVFDTRFLPNPYYIEELRHLTGNDQEIRDYVMSSDVSQKYFNHICDMVKFIIPQCMKEGRSQLIVGIGCTGGHHRSVTFAVLLERELKSLGFNVKVHHRELDKI
ncbi:MAG: RNase adapter RapZ [Clostridia bacterium]|nr:RNase adapter RapZ [Clostridia bacterium]